MNKIEDFGVHADAYYQLKVEIYKTKTDERLLELLWNKYWVATLSQSLILSVRLVAMKELMIESIIRHRPDYQSKRQDQTCRQ
jgi:COP9 signalosome complex subunit 5